MDKNIIIGSIKDVASKSNITISEAFLDAKMLVLADISGSMNIQLSEEGRRIDKARSELTNIQNENQGKVALIAFSDQCEYRYDGTLPEPSNITNLYAALQLAKQVDGLDIEIVVICDGHPDNAKRCLEFAANFETKIHTIFIGEESDTYGIEFMEKLAHNSGGESFFTENAKLLGKKMQLLLTHGY